MSKTTDAPRTLDERIERAGGPVRMLRNAPVGAYPFPIKAEFTNWRDEQRAWRTTASLMDSSFHMTDFYFKGPDVKRLLSDTGLNSLANFSTDRAKQFVACNHEGYVIADAILMPFADDEAALIGRAATPHWVAYQAEKGGYDVEVTRDYQSSMNPAQRRLFRYQVQGPLSLKVVEKAAGRPLPAIGFFRIGSFEIAGVQVRALSHSMSREFGWELTGPFEAGAAVKQALLDAGAEYGLREVGGRAYPSMAIESGWFPSPTQAIFSGQGMREYRDWLGPNAWEAAASLGGSFYSDTIEDYYFTPFNLGLDRVMKFDHDFIGRDALQKMTELPQRRKVWLRWNDDDTARLLQRSLWGGDQRTKYPDQPVSNYSTLSFDKVLAAGQIIGISANSGYSVNVGGWSSLAVIDQDQIKDGAEVTLVWGEEDGGSAKPTVERHVQAEVRATISTSPLVR
jgi:glycine cleavage system aminomethyltransferase T